jgi:hypothetical protein
VIVDFRLDLKKAGGRRQKIIAQNIENASEFESLDDWVT